MAASPRYNAGGGNPGIPPVSESFSGSGVSGCVVGGVVVVGGVSVGVCSKSAQITINSMSWVFEGIMLTVTVVD